MQKKSAVIILILAVVGGSAFYGGMKYAQIQKPTGIRNQQGFGNLSAEERQRRLQEFGDTAAIGSQGARFVGRGGENFAVGEIISKDEQSITVKLQDGGSKIIFYSDGTLVQKTIDGSIQDLSIGEQVMINGAVNQDGSLTAQTIQLWPIPQPAQTLSD